MPRVLSTKHIIPIILGSALFTDQEQEWLLCKKDLRYTKQLLHDIINEAVDLDGCSRETAEMLQNKVNRIPSGASYAKNAIRILYDVDM